MPKKLDITGQKFNRLLVVQENGRTNDGRVKWLCVCDCGIKTSVSGSELRSGGTKSCGCLASEFIINRNFRHGFSNTDEYSIWKGLKSRCYNPHETYYSHYGGRGISVCEKWLSSFENFISDVGNRPSKLHSIERKDNNGNYEPNNCYWATKKEQASNRRNNRVIYHNGTKMILQQWAEYFKVPVSTLHSQLKVNTFEDIYRNNI